LNGEDESNGYCRHQENLSIQRVCPAGEFDCSLNQKPNVGYIFPQCLKTNLRCNDNKDCPRYGSDEEKCHSQRNIRERYTKYIPQKTPTSTPPQREYHYNSSAIDVVWLCNRGVAVQSYSPSTSPGIVCLCPSSSYGNRCQYQSHRVTIIYTLEMTLNPSENNFSNIRVLTFLQYQDKTIDHMKLSFNLKELPLKRKQRFYLHYPWLLLKTIHQASSNDYTIMFHIYTTGKNLLKLFSVYRYSIKYPFLPTYRLTVILNPKNSKTCSNSMINLCGIHSQNCHLIDGITFYCECQSGWYGLHCTEQYQNVPCATDSYFLPTFYNGIDQYDDFLCICPINRYGRTCHISDTSPFLYGRNCNNNGTIYLITTDSYYDQIIYPYCSCPKDFVGSL
jgi:hypothetical protein